MMQVIAVEQEFDSIYRRKSYNYIYLLIDITYYLEMLSDTINLRRTEVRW